MTLPTAFCWTKFGVEAGESVDSIFQRKEFERDKNGGTFLWGIGNSVAPSIITLLEIEPRPQVLFTPMLSAPAALDVRPTNLVVWSSAADMAGKPYLLPHYSLVTSARGSASREAHFALVCARKTSLTAHTSSSMTLDPDLLRNLRTGARLGASQVTSVVRNVVRDCSSRGRYVVSASAELVYPYLVRLTRPLRVPADFRLDAGGTGQGFAQTVELLLEMRRCANGANFEQIAHV